MFPGLNYPINQHCFVTYIHIVLQFRTRLIILDHLKYNAVIAGYRGSLYNIFFLFAKIYIQKNVDRLPGALKSRNSHDTSFH